MKLVRGTEVFITDRQEWIDAHLQNGFHEEPEVKTPKKKPAKSSK